MPTNINDKLISWASEIDPETIRQAEKTARLPIVEGHVALMPDAHVGIGATVGSVIPTTNAVIPAAVGVDIGCGMIAAELDVTEDQLPDSLEPLLVRIEAAIPAGVGRGHDQVARNADRVALDAQAGNRARRPIRRRRCAKQFGTLGSGNHFVELCVDERSPGLGGAALGQPWHRQQARARCTSRRRVNLAKDLELRLEDPDLAYFVEGTPEFDAYITDMLWAQEYARANRDQMMDNAMREVFVFLGYGSETRRINCHHNFTQREVHDGHELWMTRKGAIKADTGDLGVIPGSMGTRSYIVRGKGSAASWTSCSHGAGRRHSRTKAKKLFSTADLAEQMKGKVWLAEPGRCARRRDPGGVQGHRCGHGRPGRPRRGPAHAASGSQLQGHLTLGPARQRAGRDTCAGEVLKEGRSVRTGEAAGSIPAAGSARVLGRTRGLEALMVERPVETRQAEIRALPRPRATRRA